MAERPLRPIAVALGMVLLVSACGGPTPSAAPGAASPGSSTATSSSQTPGSTTSAALPPDFQHVLDIPANPVAVTPTLDDARAAEKLVPITGGQLTATAADGTTFALDIPGDALSSETLIRMTPVSKLDGMPFGSDPHAVQLGPNGLHFANFVTLTITPPTAIPVDQQILFGYEGKGESLTLALPAGNTAPIAIRLLHFSGAGVTTGTAAQVAQAQPTLGATAEARITSAIAAELARERQAQLSGQGGDTYDPTAVLDLMAQFYEQVVKPRIAAAGQSCAAGTLAIQTYLGYQRSVQLLGGDAQDAADEAALVGLVGEVCVREEYHRCHDQHVIQNIVPTWLGWERNAQLLGAASEEFSDTIATYVRKCLVFDMKFESEATLSGGSGWNSSVRSNIELRFDTDALRFSFIQAPLVNFAFKFKAGGGGCTVTSIPGDGTFNAITFKYIRDTRTPTDEIGYVRDLEFGYNPGATGESVKIRCPHVSTTIPQAGFWSGSFIALHRGEGGVRDGSYTYLATDWEILGNAYYARKEWIKTGNGLIEAGTFKLYHTPE